MDKKLSSGFKLRRGKTKDVYKFCFGTIIKIAIEPFFRYFYPQLFWSRKYIQWITSFDGFHYYNSHKFDELAMALIIFKF